MKKRDTQSPNPKKIENEVKIGWTLPHPINTMNSIKSLVVSISPFGLLNQLIIVLFATWTLLLGI